jgi:uncharacterized protein (TIGR02594 family)
MSYSLQAVQRELFRRGFDPGPVDGINGPKTRAAIKAFQLSKSLTADGIIGKFTRGALFSTNGLLPIRAEPATSVPTEMPWLDEAWRLRGVREVNGSRHNPTIMNWATDLEVPYDSDETPWCGLFAGHCFQVGAPDDPMPAGLLSARAWLRYGKPVVAQLGAALVFWRGSVNGWQGHIGFYWAEDATHFHVLGGNQSNTVSMARVDKLRLLGARWPLSVDAPEIRRISTAGGVLTSVSEA